MESFLQDIRYGLRMLRKNPGFAITAMLTLALGIGANTAIFSVVNAVLVKDLSYHDPGRLVLLWGVEQQGDTRDQLSFTDIDDYRTQNRVFENVVAFGDWNAVFSDQGVPERIAGMQVDDGYFELMGGHPLLGRGFVPEEQIEGRDQVIVLGYGLWQRRFGGDPGIVGKRITLSERPYEVVGVMPKQFPILPRTLVSNGAQFYRPVADKHDDNQRKSRHLRAIARLKPEISLQNAQSDLDVINRRMAKQFPDAYATSGVRVVKLQDDIAGTLRPALLVLLAAVGTLLLIACANVANLLLARSTVRLAEIAVRAALGASRARLCRQALTESLLLALGGGVLGLSFVTWGTKAVSALGSKVIPQLIGIEIDTRVLGFTAAISVLTGLLFGLVPALQFSALSLNDTLRAGRRGSVGSAPSRFRNALAVVEVALALTLLVGTGLLLRTLSKLREVDPGFNSANILTMNLGLPSAKYPHGSVKPVNFYRELLTRISTLPGVQSAGAVSVLPLGADFDTVGIEVEGQVYGPGEQPYPERYIVTPDYLKVMQIPVVRGRAFSDADDDKSPLAVLVSETAAQSWWPKQDPVGQHIRLPGFTDEMAHTWRTVVGVVKDVKQAGLDALRTQQIYIPHAQERNGFMTVVVKTASDPLTYTAPIRRQMLSLDRYLAVSDVASMEQVLSASTATRQFSTALLGAFAALGLLLTGVGVYGILSYSVAQRTAEIGIRIALGAGQSDVLSLVIGQGLRLVLIGAAAGTVTSLLATRLMSSLLFGVGPADPVTFVSVVLLLGAVAMVASYIPALRAARLDPIVALRNE